MVALPYLYIDEIPLFDTFSLYVGLFSPHDFPHDYLTTCVKTSRLFMRVVR